ncbi:MAG: c-type cytochrome domain-containing protein [Opitutaceae bacterium]|nr:c-type cytochrome domain-containing protein [Opitutaceae bacterium]
MRPSPAFLGLVLATGAFAGEAVKKITFEDDVVPIFRDNCLKCHNPDKLKGDLDLTSFGNTLKGGGSGAAVNAGDPDGSQLYKSIIHADEPTMPPNAKLSARDIGVIRDWIAGGLLQGRSSKAIAGLKPAVDLAIKAGAVGRPEGPPPMPGPLALDPVVRAARGTALTAVAASPWAPVVALAGPRQIVLHRTDDLEFLGVLPFPDGSPADVKFSRNGKLLIAGGGRGGKSGLVTVWDIATAERVITIGDQFDTVLAADLSADQQWIALGGPDRVLKIYNTKDGALEHRLKKHTDWVTALEFSPDGKVLASGDRNGGLVLWDAANGQEMFTLPGHKGAITAISWRGDAEMLVSASEDGTLKLWKARDGSALRSLNAHPGGVLAARFAPDDRIVSSGRDHKVQVWNTTGRNVATAAFKGELPNRVAFSDDGKRIICSDWHGRVLVFDAANGKAVGELTTPPPSAKVSALE